MEQMLDLWMRKAGHDCLIVWKDKEVDWRWGPTER